MKELPCVICGRELLPADPEHFDVINQPWEANTFHSYGHWGATAFDSLGDEHLEVNICTSCLKKAADLNRVYKVTPSHPAPRLSKTEFWKPSGRRKDDIPF